ncbi:methyltransferase domain-containing protein [Tenacibaculum sp. A30]|uniref:methyltransferase domain-containing protein n=1 Tax=Tenacibaculum sp. A30 TaxID=3442644 RepID=UPI003EB78F0D
MKNIFDREPVTFLNDDFSSYINDSEYFKKIAQEYRNCINNNLRLVSILKSNTSFINKTSNDQLINALDSNTFFFYEIFDFLTKKIKIDSFSNNLNVDYLASFKYLYRDWSYNDNMENEIKLIIKNIDTIIPDFLKNSGYNAVFLGAGYGRLAVELSCHFDEVIAVDNSFTMNYIFNKLGKKNEQISFHLINLRNVSNVKYKSISSKAYLRQDLLKNYNKVKYILADCKNLPFKKGSVKIIFSIFFTDILPLNTLLKEVNRVIERGGYFIHFGPLSYHFKSITELYSADELIKVFEKNNFELIHNNSSEIKNFNIEGLLNVNSYKNLMYTFKKI